MSYEVSEEDKKNARQPHEWFLINLIFNHILLFVAALTVATSYPFMMLPIPVISFSILFWILIQAAKSRTRDNWFAMCHWQVAARRSRLFLGLLSVVTIIIVMLWIVSGGNPRPGHWAMLGAVILPTMVTILALIVMESDAMHQARHGLLPKWVETKFPNPEARLVEEAS